VNMPKLRIEIVPMKYLADKLPQLLKRYNRILLEVVDDVNVKMICSKKLKRVRKYKEI